MVDEQRGYPCVISITQKDRECPSKESRQKDDQRSLNPLDSTDSKGHSSRCNGSSTLDKRSFARAFKNIRATDWQTRISAILSLPFLVLVWIYRTIISPLTPSTCIYTPTCSQYAIEAISKHGLKGAWMSVKRIIRCRPGMPGGYDPVP